MPAKAQDDDLVMNLVELALARPAEEREDYLRSVCAADAELLTEVRNYVRWEERMNGFLLDPLYPHLPDERPFEPGQILDDRFRIVREVAEGGMGVVYEAVDEKLERRIAIKCAKAGFRKRLPPEVRNASEISHPNVCKIFEIHTTSTDRGEIDFLTMEFLEGETLAERLRRGPLPEPEARTIARQLCEGLAEAHRNRVIHGDLKSNNVILTTGADGATRAVITDFGLARGPEAVQRNVQSGELAGTPDYMAPELWKGQKASVASDLYALGVILYELASGHRPYGPEIGLPERLTRKPPAVHPKWDRILGRCLDPDPARRFRDADEVVRAFAPSHTRRRFLAIAAAVILAIATGGVTYQRATAPKESVRLAMLPFETDQNTAKLAEGLLHDTVDQLSRLKGNARTKFTVVPVADTLRKRADTTEKARALLGATHVLRATLNQSNGNIDLHAYVTEARSGVNRKDWTAKYASGQLRYAPVALAGLVTETLRLPPLTTGVTVNAAAKQDYWNGLWYMRQNSTLDTALRLLERAVIADPASPFTHAGLAEAQWFEYFLTKDQAWLNRAKESVREAEDFDPDVAPVHRVEGYLDYAAGLYERAVAEFERAIELQSSNGTAYIWLAKAHEDNGELDQALTAFQKAIEVEPNYYRTHQNLAAFYVDRANFDEAVKHLRKAVQLAPDEPDTHFALGVGYMSSGQLGAAENELWLAIRLHETTTALHTLGVVLMDQGRDSEAISYILRALRLGPERYLWWMNLGTAYRRVKLRAESERAYRRGLELAEVEMRSNPRSGYVKSQLAFLCARLEDKGRADSEIAQALQLSPNDGNVRWMAAATYEALGRRGDALAVLSASPSEVIASVSRWPDMADLHQDSRFLQLLASRQIK
jgi:tetratricopeptide (TPR) repeat protein/TolB-like protein